MLSDFCRPLEHSRAPVWEHNEASTAVAGIYDHCSLAEAKGHFQELESEHESVVGAHQEKPRSTTCLDWATQGGDG